MIESINGPEAEQSLERLIPLLMSSPDLPPPRSVRDHPRLTVQEVVYHQLPSGQAFSTGRPFSLDLKTDLLPYTQVIDVPWNWTELPMGACLLRSVDDGESRFPSQVWIGCDNSLSPRLTIPTPKETAEARSVVVEIARNTDSGPPQRFAILRPGCSLRLEPVAEAYPLFARCLSGQARLTVTAFPA